MEHEKILKNLIEIKSYSGEERSVKDFISEWFKTRGMESFNQGENLVVHFEGKDRSKAFIFNAHMDTVSAGDLPWKHGPWTPTREGAKLVGLGTSDMKSGLTATMLLAKRYSQDRPPVDLWFTYVVREEQDGSGTASLAEWFEEQGFIQRYKDMVGIFAEPTSLKEIEHGHRGNFFLKVTAKGESGHSSRPNEVKGVLAVRKIINFADVLIKSVEEWNNKFADTYFNPAITLGEFSSIYAGVDVKREGKNNVLVTQSPNKFPSTCTATFDLRTTPLFHSEAFKGVKQVAKESGVKVRLLFPEAPAGFTDPKEKIVKVGRGIVENCTLSVSQASADLGFLTTRGVKAIILGPGEKLQAHELNEFCLPDQIPQAVEIYKQIVDAWAK